MKSLHVLSVLVLATLVPAFSFAAATDRPASIKCRIVDAPEMLPKEEIVITKLNSSSPDSDLYDTSLIDDVNENDDSRTGLVELTFSNQCDNGYGMVFFESNLIDLKLGKVKSITASISGGTAEFEEEGKASMICTLK